MVLLNVSANPLAAGCMQSKSHSIFSICRKPKEWLAYELRTIVVDDPPWNTKSMNDVLFNEVNRVNGFNFSKRYGFRPLW